ncbi:MAG: hypothetical protein IPM85_07830 [Chitinophagaceae bacterium]|nr:hypothetical protein [Chitinophagaceae bacterium]
MALLESIIEVRESVLPGAGSGLFARDYIPKGSLIVEYKGRITSWNEVDHDEGKNGYFLCYP